MARLRVNPKWLKYFYRSVVDTGENVMMRLGADGGDRRTAAPIAIEKGFIIRLPSKQLPWCTDLSNDSGCGHAIGGLNETLRDERKRMISVCNIRVVVER